MNSSDLTVEVHFVPLAAPEAEERKQRLHALFLQAALRLARLNTTESVAAEITCK
jgi:hypothetical protein